MSHAATPENISKLRYQAQVHGPQSAVDQPQVVRRGHARQMADHQQQHADRHAEDQHQAEEMSGPGVERVDCRRWQQPLDQSVELLVAAAVGLALIAATRFERAAQRADRPAVGRTECHVTTLEKVLADDATQLQFLFGQAVGLACEVVPSLRPPGDQRRTDERGGECNEGSPSLCHGAQAAGKGDGGQDQRDRQRADTDRIDVVEMRPLELDEPGAEAERLVDH
jgi:hypothetical protein